jgi:6-pyruvoyltetrahydropterin/6-carboxytetrahydropterin synthase
MAENYKVRVEKDSLVFSAAHFITFAGNICERLHGHNYRVAVEIEGPLDENQYVVDFIALRDSLADIVRQLDHRVLLPTEHPTIHVQATDREVEARFEDRRWVFPKDDCVLLPVPNTTAELLARYIGQRLREALLARGHVEPQVLRVEVDECYGQKATCEMRRQ